VCETEEAIADGAKEIDMVINIGALKSGNRVAVQSEIGSISEVAHKSGAICKVIIETCLLTHDEKVTASKLAKAAGADFVKTSTGFSSTGATVHDVELMRSAVGPDMGVKASGGIRTLDDLLKMLAAGATRIGASASVKIVQAARAAESGT
jgi:deoxyribose-phosphate aldolase